MNAWWAFVAGALVWPVTQAVMEVTNIASSAWYVRRARKVREEALAAFQREKAAGMYAMTVDEWESYYGPLPTDRETLQ